LTGLTFEQAAKTLGLLDDEAVHGVTPGVEDPSEMRSLEDTVRRALFGRRGEVLAAFEEGDPK